MKKTDLLTEAGLSSATLAKLGKGEPLSGESIEKLCIYFRCQPGELVEYILAEPAADADKIHSASRRKEPQKRAPASGKTGPRSGAAGKKQN